MERTRVSAEELKQAMGADLDQLVQTMAAAMNAAKDGHIIADTEELVRDAHAVFREQAYAQAIRLVQTKQEVFSPSAPGSPEQGPTADHPSDGQRPSERA